MQAVYFPTHKDARFDAGQEMKIVCSHDEYSLWFDVGKEISISQFNWTWFFFQFLQMKVKFPWSVPIASAERMPSWLATTSTECTLSSKTNSSWILLSRLV